MKRSMIINSKTIRSFREKDREGQGQLWVCARDLLGASDMPTPRSMAGDDLAGKIGDRDVQTLKIHGSLGIHRLVYIRAEAAVRFLKLMSPGGILRAQAKQTLRGLRMQTSVIYDAEVVEEAVTVPAAVPEVTTHDFNGMALRTLLINERPWFVGADILRVLYGVTSGKGPLYNKLDADERTKVNRTILGMNAGRPVELVSESGLYKMITRSDKAAAKPFQDWITRDVLPAIRKDGTYSVFDGDEAQPPAQPSLTGEVMPPLDTIEQMEAALFKAIDVRLNESRKRRQELTHELRLLDLAIYKDSKKLELLAA